MDDDGFYYVSTLGGAQHWALSYFACSLRQEGKGGPSSQCQDSAICLSSTFVLASHTSPPQGELNGQRGLVPSNFLERPAPEAGDLDQDQDKEPRPLHVNGQVSDCSSAPVVWTPPAGELCGRGNLGDGPEWELVP